MPKYLVKNKYTYERMRQTDFTYRPDVWPQAWTLGYVQSHNGILPLYLTEELFPLGTFTFSAEAPAELWLDAAVREALPAASALRIRVTDGADAVHYRATFFGEGCTGEAGGDLHDSFSSVGTAQASKSEAGTDFALAPMAFAPVRLRLETDGAALTAEVSLTCVYDTLGEWGGQAHFYSATEATLRDAGTAMALTLHGPRGGLVSRDLPREAGGPYSMLMPRRNTLFMILRNPDGLSSARLSFTSEAAPAWEEANAVELPLCQDDAPHAYYFNLSLCPGCQGRLTAFRLESEGVGTLYIDGYSFEQEAPLESPAVRVHSCLAHPAADTLTVRGEVLDTTALAPYSGGQLVLYAGTMADAQGAGCRQETTAGKHCIRRMDLPASGTFTMADVPLRYRETTLLPYQLLLFAEADGQEPLCLAPRFYIENYEDFDTNPYAFDLPDYTVCVTDCGALGDAVHNDTDAIQAAIDQVAAAGGGRVILPGSDAPYGRRYIVTNLLLRSHVELHMEDGAILWQSQRRDHYPYETAVGHDGVIPGINWTHNLHVSNLPLLQGANLTHIKITGYGALRMMDTGSEEGVDMPGYAVGCYRRIHCIPLGLFCCTDVVTQDFDILRSNNYHTEYNHCRRVYIANLRMHQVKCVSGDGLGMASGQCIKVNRCFLQSNDDGVVMSTHLFDPRGILWWTNCRYEDNSVQHITVVHSYLNSGGGKALAFIPWGTSDPIQANEEIRHIVATDNYLVSVNPVGTWPDNPYAGRQPFDNTETDDYSPVKDVRIFGNRYEGNCTLGPIHSTNVCTDCGVHAASNFRNGDFTLGGMANWTMWPNAHAASVLPVIYADKEKGCIEHFEAGDVAAAQGLHLEAGTHTFQCELFTGESGAELFVCKTDSHAPLDPLARGEVICRKPLVCLRPTTVSLTFSLDQEEADVFLGIRNLPGDRSVDGFAVFDACVLHSQVDRAALEALRLARYRADLSARFVCPESCALQSSENKIYVQVDALPDAQHPDQARMVCMPAVAPQITFTLESAVRANQYAFQHDLNGFGYRFAIRDDGRAYRELRFYVSRNLLLLSDWVDGQQTILYQRPNFFFTSTDFHMFRLEVGKDTVSIWIDGSQYATVPCIAIPGEVSPFFCDMDASVYRLSLQEG